MNTDTLVFVLSLTMLFLGWFPAYITYRRKLIALKKVLRQKHDREVVEARQRWYKYGWDDALEDPIVVKNACNEMFHTHYV